MDRAVELYGQMIAIFDKDGDVWWRYGQANLNQKNYDKAIESLTKAEGYGGFANKYPSVVAYDLACAYALKGKIDVGYEQLNRALKLGFRDFEHMRSDEDLAPLRTDKRWGKLALLGDVSKMSRNEAWRYDLSFLDHEARRKHFSPYLLFSKKDFDSFVSQLNRDIPKLTDNQIRTRFVRYMAMFGDGHTTIRPDPASEVGHQVPIQAFIFQDGVFVTLAGAGSEDLAGAEILKIEGKPIGEVLQEIRPYVSHENDQGFLSSAPRLFLTPAFLNGIGVAAREDQLTFQLRDAGGVVREVTFKRSDKAPSVDWHNARKASGNPDPLYMKKRTTLYWSELLPAQKLLYVQYNGVRNMPGETIAQFAARLSKELEGDVEAVVLDIRWNGGGNTFLNRPLLHTFIKAKQNARGKFFVITGRGTYSACQNFATDLERETEAMFVGEPSGSSPNFIGESVTSTLPYSKMTMSVSDLYWQRSWPMDHRKWIAPDLPAVPVFSAFKENKDPAMEAILKFLAG